MSSEDSEQPEMFSREWYNEYFRRAATSQAHARFCERVYGRDLCQHGLMHMRELDFLVSLVEPGSAVLEIGCSNGHIAEYIHDRTGAAILGLDYSDVAIEQAQQRTADKAPALRFERVDLKTDTIPGEGYDLVIAIDSLYFLGGFENAIRKFRPKLAPSGRMVFSVFEVKDDDDGDEILQPDGTYLAQALQALGFEYRWHDFTAEVREHGPQNHRVAQELKEAFEAEGNTFLYEARMAENHFFKEAAEKKEIVRYMYVVSNE